MKGTHLQVFFLKVEKVKFKFLNNFEALGLNLIDPKIISTSWNPNEWNLVTHRMIAPHVAILRNSCWLDDPYAAIFNFFASSC